MHNEHKRKNWGQNFQGGRRYHHDRDKDQDQVHMVVDQGKGYQVGVTPLPPLPPPYDLNLTHTPPPPSPLSHTLLPPPPLSTTATQVSGTVTRRAVVPTNRLQAGPGPGGSVNTYGGSMRGGGHGNSMVGGVSGIRALQQGRKQQR